MKGTKLWMDAGSPLIQGRSRAQRPLGRDWVSTALGAWAIAGPLAVWLFKGYSDGRTVEYVVAAGVASALIAVPIVWFIRKLGARNPWRGSALITAALAPLAVFLYTYVSVITIGK